MSSSSSLCFSIFTTNINTTARSSSSRSKLFGVSPSSCPRRKKEPPQLFHFVDAERRRRLVKNSSHRQQHLLYKEEDNTEEEKGKPVDFYDEIIARNDALVDIMLEKIRRRESNSSNYNGDSLHREESGKNEDCLLYTSPSPRD